MWAGLRRAPSVRRSSTTKYLKLHTAIIGQGPQAAGALKMLARNKWKQDTVVITGGPSWIQIFQADHIMGQSARGLNQLSNTDRSQLSPMPNLVRTAQKDISEAYCSVLQFDAEVELSCIESSLVRADRYGPGWRLSCLDGTVVDAEQVVFCGGAGPERQLQDSGVVLLNHPTSRRAAQKEVTTALQTLEIPGYYKDKRVLLFGGGATAAWMAEIAIQGGCSDLRWGSFNGFSNADPTGVNGEIMRLTKSSRYETKLKSLEYLGDLDQVPDDGEGLEIIEFLTSSSKMNTERFDVVVCATGQNPYASTGVYNIFSKTMLNRLTPVVMNNGGVVAYTPGLIIGGPSVASMEEFGRAIKNNTFPLLEQQNHIKVGYAVSVMAGEAAAEKLLAEVSSPKPTGEQNNKA